MYQDPTIPTVRLKDLVPDSCNYADKTFESFVERFMAQFMPGFPTGLLDTDSEDAYERWQVAPTTRYVVEAITTTVFTCTECGVEYTATEAEEMHFVCCPLEGIASQDAEEEEGGEEEEVEEQEEKYEPMTSEEVDWLVLRDTDYAQVTYVGNAGDEQLTIPDYGVVWGWRAADDDDAEDKANELNQENSRESSYGFPWAHSWCHMPDDAITDEDLEAAGFRVAMYCGGGGNWRQDQDYRLAGIDGGGYSFSGQHFSKLCAIVHERHGWPVETEQGQRYITTGEKEEE